MSLISFMSRTALIGGAAGAVVAIALVPAVRRRLRPLIKDAVKGGLVAAAALERQWAELVEEAEDLAAEIHHEMAEEVAAEAEPAAEHAAALD